MNLDYRYTDEYIFISNNDAVGKFEDVLVYYSEIDEVLNGGSESTQSPDGTLKNKWIKNGSFMYITQITEADEHSEMDIVSLNVPIHNLRMRKGMK